MTHNSCFWEWMPCRTPPICAGAKLMDRHSMSTKRGHTESISSIPEKGVKVCVF
jgi:hypothetical protein